MVRRVSSQPTDRELEILQVLWEQGPSTVRQVHGILAAQRPTAYSTVLTMMQLMRNKGLLARDDSVRPQMYQAVLSREKTQSQMLNGLLSKVFGGSVRALVMRALSSRKLKPQELAEMRKLVEEAERQEGNP